jgi:hypothetical protein
MHSGRFSAVGWWSPIFFQTSEVRSETLKCLPYESFQILRLLRAFGTEKDADTRNRRYVLTFEQIRRLAGRA